MNRKAKSLEFADAAYNIQITGRHIEVTDSMKDYALEKISRIERFMNRIIDVNLIMDIQKMEHRVEIILKAGNTRITSKASTTDMYVSIDQAVNKLETQILRYKSKLHDYHAKGHAELNVPVSIFSTDEIDEDLDEEAENQETNGFRFHRVIKQETLPLKTLTYDEAIMKMELSSDTLFMVFKNEADQKLKVIYRCKDGNYGIIEPTCEH